MNRPDPSILGPGVVHAAVDKTLAAHRRFLYLCGCLFVLTFAWSALTSLDIVSEAVGEVIPRTKVKKIQHLEGGIVREILVREGDLVKQDQPLVVLDAAAAEANTDELAVRLNSLMIESLRLEAESQGLPEPKFTPELELKHKDLVDQARNLFQARKKRVQTDISSQAERVRQREQDIHETGARLENLKRNLPLVQRQVQRSEELYRERLGSSPGARKRTTPEAPSLKIRPPTHAPQPPLLRPGRSSSAPRTPSMRRSRRSSRRCSASLWSSPSA